MQKILGIHDKEAIDAMLAHVVSECGKVDIESAFDDMLDECFSFEHVGGIFAHMSPSRVLKECDPTAYRCWCNDWADGERLIEIENDSYAPDDVNKASEEFIDGLRDELTDLKAELEEFEAENDTSLVHAMEAKREEIKRKESAIKACENHAW